MSQKVKVLDAYAMRCMASATSEVAAVLQYDEQACQEWVLGEMSYSLSGNVKKQCAIGRKSCRRCSLTTHHCWRPRTDLEVVVESVRCVDLYTIVSLSKVILCNRCTSNKAQGGVDFLRDVLILMMAVTLGIER